MHYLLQYDTVSRTFVAAVEIVLEKTAGIIILWVSHRCMGMGVCLFHFALYCTSVSGAEGAILLLLLVAIFTKHVAPARLKVLARITLVAYCRTEDATLHVLPCNVKREKKLVDADWRRLLSD